MSKNLMVLPILLLAVACTATPPSDEGPLTVVATTGMIGDAALAIAGDRAEVISLMGPGVDPHLFKASEGDVGRLTGADLILYNGLHLEGKMGDVLEKVGRSRPVIAVAETVPESEHLLADGAVDPHLWFDVALWQAILDPIVEAFAEVDPEGAELYRANGEAYRERLVRLDAWVGEQIATIPTEQRVLVTAHDAFGYFGRAYAIEVIGLQGMSTIAEAGIGDIERVVDLIVERRIPAIFVESSVPRRAIEAVQAACAAQGHAVTIGGELFSDAMGAAGTPEGTYEGMVRHNVTTLVEALSPR